MTRSVGKPSSPAKASVNPKPMKPPSATRQVEFHTLLIAARKTVLIDALGEALGKADPVTVKTEILQYVPPDVQQILAKAGIRDDHIFPLPALLKESPQLVGYYRLLLGIPQKTFYGTGTGMGQIKGMETNGKANASQLAALPQFCEVMATALADLVRQISPTISDCDIRELPLLTLGSQLQGGNNNAIGRKITEAVIQAIASIVGTCIKNKTETRITVQNPSGKLFDIKLASDPDVTIEEHLGANRLKIVAIEIKGGTDGSNAHNRAGEAEKSHIKARAAGFRTCWTLFHFRGLNRAKLEVESPTTNTWYEVAEVVEQAGPEWDSFQAQIKRILGLP